MLNNENVVLRYANRSKLPGYTSGSFPFYINGNQMARLVIESITQTKELKYSLFITLKLTNDSVNVFGYITDADVTFDYIDFPQHAYRLPYFKTIIVNCIDMAKVAGKSVICFSFNVKGNSAYMMDSSFAEMGFVKEVNEGGKGFMYKAAVEDMEVV